MVSDSSRDKRSGGRISALVLFGVLQYRDLTGVSTGEAQATDSADEHSCFSFGFVCVWVFYATLRYII